jgi:transcriptional regulator with XRE-family HTH domain
MANTELEDVKARELEFRKRLGIQLRELRKARGLGQDAFADLAGIHRTHVGMLENGKLDPKLSTLSRVAEALGLEFWKFCKLE